jgi:hypothetical protein
MFTVPIGGVYVSAPTWHGSGGNDVQQYQNQTSLQLRVSGKPGLIVVVEAEKETSVGSGVFTSIGTRSVTISSDGSAELLNPIGPFFGAFGEISGAFSGAQLPGSTGFKYRARVISPIVTSYSTEVTNTTTYIADPTSTALGFSINAGRDIVTMTYTGPGNIIASSYSTQLIGYNSGFVQVCTGNAGSASPVAVTLTSALPVGGYVKASAVHLDRDGGGWVLASTSFVSL